MTCFSLIQATLPNLQVESAHWFKYIGKRKLQVKISWGSVDTPKLYSSFYQAVNITPEFTFLAHCWIGLDQQIAFIICSGQPTKRSLYHNPQPWTRMQTPMILQFRLNCTMTHNQGPHHLPCFQFASTTNYMDFRLWHCAVEHREEKNYFLIISDLLFCQINHLISTTVKMSNWAVIIQKFK